MSGVCLVLAGPTLEDCRAQLAQSRPYLTLAEVRADLLERSEWAGLNEFSRQADVPLILTLRQVRHGGQWAGSSGERLAFFQVALEGEWTWLDIEDDDRLPEVEAAWRARGRELVVSFHDFSGVPAGWTSRMQASQGPGVTAKAAVFPTSSGEYLRFLQDLKAFRDSGQAGPFVALAMGGYGFSSRILADRLGSRWTYATVPGQTIAPGQTDPETLETLYRFSEQSDQTPVYGIVGNPVFHTKSPIIHNPALAHLGLRGTYVPFLADDLPTFFSICDLLDVRGLSCTIPFKEDVLLYLGTMSPAVRATGACNTLWREGEGRPWNGDNTDAPGFMAPLEPMINDWDDLRATVVGTGGAARGIVWALRQKGVKVVVLGRTPANALALAQEFGAEWAPLGPESRLVVEDHPDLIVQTTSVGMGETAGQDPLEWYDFTGREIAYDIIYSPRWTTFLTRARDAGCRILFGEDMLVNQAFGQFKRFTGRDYPPEALNLDR